MFDFADDNSIFFADSAHTAVVGGNDPVPVIYDAPFKLEQVYEGQMETSSPACSMQDGDVTRLGIQHATVLSIYKRTSLVGSFEVSGIEPDGMGITRLILTKDP